MVELPKLVAAVEEGEAAHEVDDAVEEQQPVEGRLGLLDVRLDERLLQARQRRRRPRRPGLARVGVGLEPVALGVGAGPLAGVEGGAEEAASGGRPGARRRRPRRRSPSRCRRGSGRS